MIFLFLLQISLDCSDTCITTGVLTPVLRPFTTPRRGAVSRARTTANNAQAQPTASNVTRPTTSLMVHVQSWSVEKVNKVTALFMSFFSFICCVRYDIENHCLTPVHPPLSHPLFFWLCPFLYCPSKFSFSFFSGEVEDPDYEDCMACEEGCRKCVLCKSQVYSHNDIFPKMNSAHSRPSSPPCVLPTMFKGFSCLKGELCFCLLSTDNPKHCLSCIEGFYK